MTIIGENKLETITYNNYRRKWNFEKNVRLYKYYNKVLDRFKENRYSRINQSSKFRYLIYRINNNTLDLVKKKI